MSPLTKVLIILLTVSSIFLCGIVVTYVANADNYRQMYLKVKVERDAAVQRARSADSERNDTLQKADQREKQLNDKLAALQTRIEQLQIDLNDAEREKRLLLQKV